MKRLIDARGIFFGAFLQVNCVAANTVFVSKDNIPMIVLFGFLISWMWSGNVKRITFAGKLDRAVYATGAMIGSISGYFLAKLINHLIFVL